VVVSDPLAALEVATPLPSSGLAPPIWAPPLGHAPPVNCEGLQRKKVTVPVGVPAPPETVAWSVTGAPGVIGPPVDDLVCTVGCTFSTVKHSSDESVSLPGT
jgi:hypothetical protein